LPRKTANYVCQDCGASAPKWTGRCESCGAWNSLVEEAPAESAPKGLGGKKGRKIVFESLKGKRRPARAGKAATPSSTG
jgi:DNA repair protein RadA/Sms